MNLLWRCPTSYLIAQVDPVEQLSEDLVELELKEDKTLSGLSV
jgi:hypothetical protein